jgi:F-type H+-transporting ATPase subunit b
MPQFDVETFPSLLFWLVISFVSLYAGLKYLVLPKLSATLDERQETIFAFTAKAELLRKKGEELQIETEAKLKRARDEIQRELQETTKNLTEKLKDQEALLLKKMQKEEVMAEEKIQIHATKIQEELSKEFPLLIEAALQKILHEAPNPETLKKHLDALKKGEAA